LEASKTLGTEVPVGLEGEQRGRQHRKRDEDQDASDEHVPAEDRHPEHGHAGRAQREHRRDQVDRAQHRADAGQRKAEDPHVGANARREDNAVERGVGEPAEVGRAVGGQEPADDDEAAEQVKPVGQRVEPRERDVRRADLQRDDEVREAEGERRCEQEHHDRAVHRYELVVLLVRHQLQAGPGRASSARMNSAMIPARMKKKNAVQVYMMPMVLWFVVVM